MLGDVAERSLGRAGEGRLAVIGDQALDVVADVGELAQRGEGPAVAGQSASQRAEIGDGRRVVALRRRRSGRGERQEHGNPEAGQAAADLRPGAPHRRHSRSISLAMAEGGLSGPGPSPSRMRSSPAIRSRRGLA